MEKEKEEMGKKPSYRTINCPICNMVVTIQENLQKALLSHCNYQHTQAELIANIIKANNLEEKLHSL